MRAGRPLFELLFAVAAVALAAPLWLVDHPPIQDLPQHLAAVRVLSSYGDPQLGFSSFFEVDLLRTQYLAFYGAAVFLSWIVGVFVANKLLLSLAIVALPYSLRALLYSLGRAQWKALLALPLVWNAHVILGFLNFFAAIPMCLFGLAIAVTLRRRFTRGRALALFGVTLLTFLTHVVPFALLGLGAALVALEIDRRESLKETLKASALLIGRRWLPLVPGGLLALSWSFLSSAGRSTVSAATGEEAAQFASWMSSLSELPGWLTDVFAGDQDGHLLIAWLLLVLALFALFSGRQQGRTGGAWAVAVLAPISGLLYFLAPASYRWIWPINARFAVLCLILLVPALPSAPRRLRPLLFLIAFGLSMASAQLVGEAFVRFEREEVGRLEEAIEAIPPGSKVAGLIFDRGSQVVRFAPFIHSVAYYQARRGGAVMFTFADFPQSPFVFREDRRPPPVGPRWEWTPERVDPERDLAWYEYVLVRGRPGRIARQPRYERMFESDHWSVWRRRGPLESNP